MKPIILLAVMAIAGTGLGVGFLGNTITLDLQSLGVGEEDLVKPITNANIKFNVVKEPGNQNNFKNVIADCIIESTDVIVKDSKIFCKLTDENGNVAAEGVKILDVTHLPANTPTVIHIDDPQFVASQVQNVHDVVLVVLGPSTQQP